MNAPIMEDKRHGETIIDNSPKEPFVSPLQMYIAIYCDRCDYKKSKCRLDDESGMKRIELCMRSAAWISRSMKGLPFEDNIAEILAKGLAKRDGQNETQRPR